MNTTIVELWKYFYPNLKLYRGWLIALAFFPVVWCLVETIAPFLIKIIIDRLASHASESSQVQGTLIQIVLLYMFLILVLEITIRGCNYVWIKTFPRIRSDIQSNVLSLIQARNYQFFYNQLSGDLINKYRNLTDSFENIFKNLLYGFYPALLSFGFSLVFIAFINLTFAVIFLFWFLAMTLVTVFFCKRSILASQDHAKSQNLLFGYVGDMMGNVLTLMAYPRDLSQEKNFQKLQRESVDSTQRAEFITFKADTWRSILSWLLLASMIVFLSYGWQRNWITLGDFSFIAAICFYVRRTIWMTSTQLSDLFKELGTAKEALSLIQNGNSQINEVPVSQKISSHALKSTIDFSQISFGYSKDKLLFDNLNLQIPAAQKLGISGASGVGKTSLVHLLLRLHDPAEGTIYINGEDYRDIPVGNLRDLFSYVPQNAMLLHCSIFDNIAFGKPLASQEEIYEAARVCLCEEFIHSLEMGYDTIVGEGGYKLSGGQRQRIAIARACLKRAPVFVLDEATSALDIGLEEELLEQLISKLKDHTIILISHRDSSLRKMDRVIEFKKGHITLDNLLN